MGKTTEHELEQMLLRHHDLSPPTDYSIVVHTPKLLNADLSISPVEHPLYAPALPAPHFGIA